VTEEEEEEEEEPDATSRDVSDVNDTDCVEEATD